MDGKAIMFLIVGLFLGFCLCSGCAGCSISNTKIVDDREHKDPTFEIRGGTIHIVDPPKTNKTEPDKPKEGGQKS